MGADGSVRFYDRDKFEAKFKALDVKGGLMGPFILIGAFGLLMTVLAILVICT